jgi:hypothetical protein
MGRREMTEFNGEVMRTKQDAKIDKLNERITALEDAMDIVATQLNEQIQLNMVLRALLEELTEKRK